MALTMSGGGKLTGGSQAAALCVAVLFALPASGCSGGDAKPPLAPALTRLDPPLPSHRCEPGARSCACRRADDPGEKNPVPEGYHRFEFVIYNSLRSEAELRVPGLPYALHPSGESLAPECWYVDIVPGIHPVTYRIAPADGRDIKVGLQIWRYAELADGADPHWYQLLDFKCGAGPGGECTPDEMRAWLDRYRRDRKRLVDPCANAEIQSPSWAGASPPTEDAYDELEIGYKLLVMRPAPTEPPCLSP